MKHFKQEVSYTVIRRLETNALARDNVEDMGTLGLHLIVRMSRMYI